LIGFHVSVVVGILVAIDLAVQGRTRPAIALAILSGITATALALWWIVQLSNDSAEPRERVKKGVDVVSLASLALFVGVWIWVATWAESPRAPGHISVESKILVWNGVPFVFGGNWLLVRYAKAATEKFPLVFGRPGAPGIPRQRGLLFYFVCIFIGGLVCLRWVATILEWLLGTPSVHN
jgi:hypothetical protein